MEDCKRKGKWFGGCNFEPRYDTGPADLSQIDGLSSARGSFFERLRPVTYVGDVCTRCGKQVKRDENASKA